MLQKEKKFFSASDSHSPFVFKYMDNISTHDFF